MAHMSRPFAPCTTSQLAAMLAVDPATVRRWVARGRLRPAFTTPGGHHRFDPSAVVDLLAERQIPGTYERPARCPDCGEPDALPGHMECPTPRDHP